MKTETDPLSHHDELLIQRCLDNELSSDDKRAFLNRLDHLRDGWKTLACGFLSERSISQTVRGPAGRSDSSPAESSQKSHNDSSWLAGQHSRISHSSANDMTSAKVSLTQRMPRWWSHPLTSLALCAAIAFVAGTLVPDREGSLPSGISLNRPEQRNQFSTPGIAVRTGPAEYSVERLPDGSLLNQPVRIPVTDSPEELGNVLQQSPELRRQLEAGTIRMMRVSTDDGKDILFFVNERDRSTPFQ
ncbi:MAG: hypothetical protein ACK526_15140 [Planctomyces sp.]